MVFKNLLLVRIGRVIERSGVLPTTQLEYRKGLDTCDALLCKAHTLQSALASGQQVRIVQIEFSEAFDRVNDQGILFKLCFVGVGVSVLFVLTQFLSIGLQQVIVYQCRSKLVNVLSGVPQRSVLVPLLFLLYNNFV